MGPPTPYWSPARTNICLTLMGPFSKLPLIGPPFFYGRKWRTFSGKHPYCNTEFQLVRFCTKTYKFPFVRFCTKTYKSELTRFCTTACKLHLQSVQFSPETYTFQLVRFCTKTYKFPFVRFCTKTYKSELTRCRTTCQPQRKGPGLLLHSFYWHALPL